MKIAYIGNFTQSHCTEVHLAATLEDLGHQIIRIQENEIGQTLSSECDLLLWTRTWPGFVKTDFLEGFKMMGVPTVSYHLDLYVGIQREAGLDTDPFWKTDFVFTPDGDPESAKIFKSKGINHFYLPPGVWKPECVKGTSRDEFKHDVIFVGGGHTYHPEDWPYRAKLIEWLRATYGPRFQRYGHPRTIRNMELNDLYASAKVVVGDSLCMGFNHERYWSDRLPETLGRGGFLIFPYIKGLETQYTDDELVTYTYDNFANLKELIDYYVEHDEEREEIRDLGMLRTEKDHTYHNRLTKMLEIVNAR